MPITSLRWGGKCSAGTCGIPAIPCCAHNHNLREYGNTNEKMNLMASGNAFIISGVCVLIWVALRPCAWEIWHEGEVRNSWLQPTWCMCAYAKGGGSAPRMYACGPRGFCAWRRDDPLPDPRSGPGSYVHSSFSQSRKRSSVWQHADTLGRVCSVVGWDVLLEVCGKYKNRFWWHLTPRTPPAFSPFSFAVPVLLLSRLSTNSWTISRMLSSKCMVVPCCGGATSGTFVSGGATSFAGWPSPAVCCTRRQPTIITLHVQYLRKVKWTQISWQEHVCVRDKGLVASVLLVSPSDILNVWNFRGLLRKAFRGPFE